MVEVAEEVEVAVEVQVGCSLEEFPNCQAKLRHAQQVLLVEEEEEVVQDLEVHQDVCCIINMK